MTTIQEVENELRKFVGIHELAAQWLQNDIIKMKIVQAIDDWILDHEDNSEAQQIHIEGHVESFLLSPEIILGE